MRNLQKYTLPFLMVLNTASMCAMDGAEHPTSSLQNIAAAQANLEIKQTFVEEDAHEKAQWRERNKNIPSLTSIATRQIAIICKKIIDKKEKIEVSLFVDLIVFCKKYKEIHPLEFKEAFNDIVYAHTGEVLIREGQLFNDAIENNHIQMIHLLVSGGADVNLKDDCGKNALQKAVELGKIDQIKLLLDCGANIDIQDPLDFNYTPLYKAIRYKYDIEIIKLLLNRGAKMDFRDDPTLRKLASPEIKHLIKQARINKMLSIVFEDSICSIM